jgi:hypothetical protein
MSGHRFFVIPAQAGIHGHLGWRGTDVPCVMAFEIKILDSRLRGNDGEF